MKIMPLAIVLYAHKAIVLIAIFLGLVSCMTVLKCLGSRVSGFFRRCLAALLVLVWFCGGAVAATVTPATGGGSVASNTAVACSAAGSWSPLTGPTITETSAGNIGSGTIILKAPSGFEFDTAAAVTVLLSGSGIASFNINDQPSGTSLAVSSVTASTITLAVTASSTFFSNTLTWQGIRVRPSSSTPLVSGNITLAGTSGIVGVSAATNLGTLTEVTSTPACFSVVSMNAASTNPNTINSSVSWTVLFNTPVTGVDPTDFVLVPGGGATGASITSVTGSGSNWTVTANTGTAYGTLGLNLVDDDSIKNATGMVLGGVGAGNGNFSGAVYTLAAPAPVLTKTASTAAATKNDVMTFSMTATNPFGVDMLNVAVSDVLPTGMNYAAHATSTGTVSVVGQTVSWSISKLLAGQTAQLTLAVKLTQQGKLTNTLTSAGSTPASATVLVLANAVTHYQMDGAAGSWDGSAGQVTDTGTTGLNGTRVATGTPTATNIVNPSPSIASQNASVVGGFCNAASFDGKAVVQVAHNALFDYSTQLSASAWIYPTAYPSELSSILSNDQNYEFHLNPSGQLYWWWGASSFTSATSIPLNRWTHIAITMDSSASAGRERIYINGVADTNTNNWKGTLVSNPCPFYIGGDVDTGSCALLPARNFQGKIDEVKLYNFELSAPEVLADMTLGRNCSGNFDHIQIEHDGTGSICQPKTVTVKACLNADCSTLYPGDVSVQMTPAGWVGGDTIVIKGGVGTASLNHPSAGNVTLGAVGATPAASGVARCFNGSSETCVVNFANASCAFDAVEPGAAPNTHLFTKLAGVSFAVDVLALSGSSVNTGYTGTVSADLVDSSSSVCPTGSGLTSTQSLTFTAANAGRKPVTFNYAGVAKNVRVRMVVGSGTAACSTDNFAVRPSAVTLLTTATATPPSASATPIVKAGANFSLQATTSPSTGYNGNLTQDTTKFTAQVLTQDSSQASGGTVGALTPATLVANAAAVNATYSEVGYLYLTPGAYRDDSWTAVDSAAGDCITDTTSNGHLSDALVGGKYGCSIGNKTAVSLGRFVPDRFTVTAGAPVAACTVHPAAAGSYVPTDFTFFSQAQGFETPFTLTAVNVAGAPTLNYGGVFARISPWNSVSSSSSWAWSGAASSSGLRFGTLVALPAGSALTAATSGGVAAVPTGTWISGVATLGNVKHQINRPTALTGDTAVNVTAWPLDPDGVTMASATTITSSASSLRYGRLRLQNAFGSEKLALAIPIQSQYWNGSFFVNNVDDSCTVLALPAVQTLTGSAKPNGAAGLYFYPVTGATGKNQLLSTDTVPTLTSPLVAGKSSLQFPASTHRGWLDVILQVPTYLLGNWGNCNGQLGAAGLDDDLPCARATFGVFGAQSPIIYRRENY